ncbi:hypothetical protein GCM10022251_38500 [Phytohabitans flavus]|uniref:Uncharacterized protein n=1 Tax=Phytohabitans flavus TaxID=1076124 RepID=A0A6F8XVL0_9ACTN|nr:hypothetical protein [Phytohabitans flavus]BCB77827.1 hypothetical protein Pflav_042370 [Phytohabitans flavus]
MVLTLAAVRDESAVAGRMTWTRRGLQTATTWVAIGAYLAVVLTLALIAFWPGSDHYGAYISLWVLCLPTSLLLGPFWFIAAGLADFVLDEPIWLFHVAWWCLVAALQIIVVSLLARLWSGLGACADDVAEAFALLPYRRRQPAICRRSRYVIARRTAIPSQGCKFEYP